MPFRVTECPRDAWQGLSSPIPAEVKADYMQLVLEAGFRRVDFGSYVSPRMVPQMADTSEVAALLHAAGGRPDCEWIAIVANARGAQDAARCPVTTHLGFPFSMGDTFQQRNTGLSVEQSWPILDEIRAIAADADKTLLVYLSMGFGNPDNEPWSPGAAAAFAASLFAGGAQEISLSDTVGLATPETVLETATACRAAVPDIPLMAHLHSTAGDWRPKVEAAIVGGVDGLDMANLLCS